MRTDISQRINQAARTARSRAADALPTILVYIVLFISITALFGTQHTMIVSCAVCIFQARRRRATTRATCVGIFCMNMVLTALAWLAAQHILLTILLNAAVPFLLVLAQSNQFMPKGYFGFVMTFVLLQLRPPAAAELPLQFAVVAFASVILMLAIAIWNRWQRRIALREPDVISNGLDALADLFDRMARGERGTALQAEFLKLERTFDRLRVTRHHFLRTPDRREYLYTMCALLFQRGVYLFSDDAWQRELDEETDLSVLAKLADFVRRAGEVRETGAYLELAGAAQRALYTLDLPEGRLRIFVRSFLHLLSTMLRLEAMPAEPQPRVPWRAVPWRDIVRDLAQRFNFDAFEFRFACRLSVVLVISFSVTMLFSLEHLYWLPLNAFLLLMPSYEESTHRMRTRPIGTALGSLASLGLTQVLPGTLSVFAVSLVLISIMYCAVPGSWFQALCSTTFALLMTSLALDTATAAWLRCLYVALAVALVLVVNRFVAPSRRKRVFEGNLRELTALIRSYWSHVQRGIAGQNDLTVAGELLTYFHMVYAEATDYVKTLSAGPERSALEERLLTLWHLFSEVEQVEYLVMSETIAPADLLTLDEMAEVLKTRPNPATAHDLLLARARTMRSASLRYVLERYLAHAERFSETAMTGTPHTQLRNSLAS